MLKNFILETTSAPGTSTTITLAGVASAAYSTFASQFSSGDPCYFTITDSTTKSQTFRGTFTSGTPNTLSVLATYKSNAGTTTRLNFTGTCYVSNFIPAEQAVYLDASSAVSLPGALTVTGTSTFGTVAAAGSFAVSAIAAGYRRHPGGITEQWGNSTGPTATITFPVAFSSSPWAIHLTSAAVASTGATGYPQVTATVSASAFNAVTVSSAGVGVTMQFYWRAVGPT